MGEANNICAELRFGVSVLLGPGPALVAVVGLTLAGCGYVAGGRARRRPAGDNA